MRKLKLIELSQQRIIKLRIRFLNQERRISTITAQIWFRLYLLIFQYKKTASCTWLLGTCLRILSIICFRLMRLRGLLLIIRFVRDWIRSWTILSMMTRSLIFSLLRLISLLLLEKKKILLVFLLALMKLKYHKIRTSTLD